MDSWGQTLGLTPSEAKYRDPSYATISTIH